MNYTYEADKSGGLIAEGDYEATLERMERKTLPSGKEKISCMFRIRSDVEQKYGNKCVFDDIWAEKDNPGVFNRRRLNQLMGTQEIEDGHVFEDINEVIDFLLGSNLIIHVGVEFDNYHGEDVNKVSYYKSSKAKPQSLGAKPEESKNLGKVEVEEDDLPF